MSQDITTPLQDQLGSNGTHGLSALPSFYQPEPVSTDCHPLEYSPAQEAEMYAAYLAGVQAREAERQTREAQNRRDDEAAVYKRTHCGQCGATGKLYPNAVDKLCKRCHREFLRSYNKTEIAQRLKQLTA